MPVLRRQDWQGTERVRTTYNGGVEGSFSSLPFGDGFAPSGSDTDANHYATLDHDTESDTEHAEFRQYSSAQGHWLAADPYDGSYDASNPQSFNRYNYAGNNPLSSVDSQGLASYPWCTPNNTCSQAAQSADGDDDDGGFASTLDGFPNSGSFASLTPTGPFWNSNWQQVLVVNTAEQPYVDGDTATIVGYVWVDFGS
jgi:RHS repeat-associated protein